MRLIICLLCCALPQMAQTNLYDGKTIVEVSYEPAIQPLAPGDMERVQLVHPGNPLRSADVAETIQRMFATGRFADIQVNAQPSGAGVAIRFITRTARFIAHVETTGKTSNPPSEAETVAATQLSLGAPFEADLLPAAQKNIQQLFTSNGLYHADVRLETMDDPEHQQVSVRIVVNAGPRARYETPVIRGDTKLSDATIIRATGWKIWLIGRWRHVTQTLSRKATDDVGKKYQKEDRLTATVDLASLDYDSKANRVKPSLDINAGPKVQVKAIEAKVSKGRLRRYVPIYQEGAVDTDLLVEGQRNLRDYFQSKGYPDVDVSFRQLPPQNDQETIEYLIGRGPRRKLARVEIQGNRYFDRNTIRERMILEPASLRLRWGRYSEAFRKRDEQTISELYNANGFRDVKVVSRLESNIAGKPDQIGVAFTITEGPQWLISHLEVTGGEHLDPEALKKALGTTDGEPYSDLNIAEDRSRILTLCYSKGFRLAAFEASTSPASANRVNLQYKIVEGPREFVREVLITGLKNTRRSLVERNLDIRSGDPLSLPQDREDQRRLYNLGVFSRVDTAIQDSDGEETYKYVLFDMTEAHKYTMNIGVGAEIAQLGATTSNLSSPTGGTGFSPRFSMDLSRLNLWGIGHTAVVQTRLSSLEQRVGLSYIDPKLWNDPARSLTLSILYDVTRDIRTFASHREEASVQFTQKFTKATSGLFRFAYRRVSTSDVVIPALLIPQFLQPVRIGILSGNIVQDRRDSPTNPHSGMYNTVDVGVASSVFGSQRNFARILARNATYYRLSRNVVLARQITFGAILPFNVGAGLTTMDDVPLPERFFGGGNISHRGFPENQAGPRDTGSSAEAGGTQTQPTGFPLGGNAVLISNIELRFPLLGENIGGVLFHDAGNVYSSIGDISLRFHQNNLQDFNYMVHAVGFGIRYKTPVGPVRVDLAYSINPPRFAGFQGTVQDLLNCNPNLPPSQLPSQCQPVNQSISHFQFFFSIGQTF